MAGRTSARSSTTRDQASSPPKDSRQSQSPVGRRTRSSRSRSVDPEPYHDAAMKKTRVGRRGTRQGSADSIASGTSSTGAASAGPRARNISRVAAAAHRDLSMVVEDRESEQSNDDADDNEDAEIENVEPQNQRSQSPGGMSQMSGTTAITSYSQGEMSKMDSSIMAEFFPELHRCAYKILDLLAPLDPSEEQLESIMNDLKNVGSRLASRLRLREELFNPQKYKYGSDTYIRPSFVLRKLFGSEDPGDGNFRPDPVMYEANLATLVIELLVMQKKSQATRSTLQGLCQIFPEAFMGKFEDGAQAVQSNLLDETFQLALDLHTQYAIAYLARMNEDSVGITPEQVLGSLFFDTLPEEVDPQASFEEIIWVATPKNILRLGETYSEHHTNKIRERLEKINQTIRHSNEAREGGDPVDFEQLEALFPWKSFLIEVVQWSRQRLSEILKIIEDQGGVDEIAESLSKQITKNDSQVEAQYEPLPLATGKELLPPANITQSNRSFLRAGATKILQRMKKQTPSISSSSREIPAPQPPSSRTQPRSRQASVVPVPAAVRAQHTSKLTQHDTDDFQPNVDDGNEDPADEEPRPTAEIINAWDENNKEKDKENHRPKSIPAVKRRMIDPQPNAERISHDWDISQENIAGPSVQRRARPELEREESRESEESEDEGYEKDGRRPIQTRRDAAPPASPLSPDGDLPSSPKRQRTNYREASPPVRPSNTAARRQERETAAMRRREMAGEGDFDAEIPPPTATEISAAARSFTARAKAARVPQKRKGWSDRDSEQLERGIAKYGCSWSTIFKNTEWEVERDQVALKDKARNMKVNYLKTGVPLPINFEYVPLGQKELRLVRVRFPDYEE